jgi:hypothetical protein
MSLGTGRIAALAAVIATSVVLVGATQASAAIKLTTTMSNWPVTGFLTPKKTNEAINIPQGATFNGAAELSLGETITGTIHGSVFVPPIHTTVKFLGVPTEVEATFQTVGEPVGTIETDPNKADCAGQEGASNCLTATVPTKANLGVTEVGLLGIGVPTHCETSEPVAFLLHEHVSFLELVIKGTHFTGEVTIPPMKCEGLESLVLSPLMTELISGPENQFELNILNPNDL